MTPDGMTRVAEPDGREHEPGPRWIGPDRVFLFFLAIYGLISLATVSSRGIPWDEPVQAEYGRAVVSWYTSGFRDRSAISEDHWNLFLYGGAVEAVIETAVGLVGRDPFLVRHLLLVLISLVGVWGTYLLGSVLGGKWTGLLAALLLAVSPRFFAHGSFNSKDIPFAVFYTWSMFLLARDLARPTGSRLRGAATLGLVTGLLLGVRIAGSIVLIPILVGYSVKWWDSERSSRALVSLGARFSSVLLIAWVVMLLAWPWAQLAPIVNPLSALFASSSFLSFGQELFQGQFLAVKDLPLSYAFVWLFRTLPEATLIGLASLGSLILLRQIPSQRIRDPVLMATLAALMFPLAWLVASGANLYDGIRQLFFIQPLLALAAAAGIVGVTRRVSRRFKIVVLAAAGAAVSVTVFDAVRLHPFEQVYFNRVSGGLPAAAGNFEMDYWGLSYRQGAEWLNQNIPASPQRSVASCSRPESTGHFLSEDFVFLGSLTDGLTRNPDYLLYTAPHDCGAPIPPGELVHAVTRDGVAILTIISLPPGDQE